MRMRAVVVVVAVLVLGAWTCAPTGSPGSAGVADVPISTTGLTALVGGEDWHYVGEAGEPAFGGTWANSQSGFPKTAFRLAGIDRVEIIGTVYAPTTPGTTTVFTLPAGYRPTATYTPINGTMINSGVSSPRVFIVTSGGEFQVGAVGEAWSSGNEAYYVNAVFPLSVPTVL